MILKYMGHSFFTITTEGGTVVATDPYGDFYNYPKRHEHADICTVSHHHHDHDGLECLSGSMIVIDTAGEHKTETGVRILGVRTKHDSQNGTLRGDNIFFVIQADGLRIGHAGDLGHALTREQIRAIGTLDILLIPVGGYYTLDAKLAQEVIRQLSAKVTIPMHYQTEFSHGMPIAKVDVFLSQMGENPAPMPLVRIMRGDISERPNLIVLTPCKG